MLWMNEIDEAVTSADASAVFVVALPRIRRMQIRAGVQGMQHIADLLVTRVKSAVRQAGYSKVFARFSGMEVITIVPGLKKLGEIASLGETIRQCCSRPLAIENERFGIDAIVGISISPDDGRSAKDLISRAQIAADNGTLTHARAPIFFAGPMAQVADTACRIEMELRSALENRGFNIVFQPQYATKQKGFAAAEALVRWNHPSHGVIPPSDFIPIAEAAGLVSELGSYVLHEAVVQINEFRLKHAPLDLAVNVSPSQLVQEDFVDEVDDLLRSVGMPAEALTIEVTEGELLFDIDMAIHQLSALRRLGVRSSIDDFGAGFSNLAYLHRLPLDQVKVDRSFVQQLGTDEKAITLLRSTIELGQGLGLEVCVEGVEDIAQYKLLEKLGCDLIQGYLFSRPLPVNELAPLVKNPPIPASIARAETVMALS